MRATGFFTFASLTAALIVCGASPARAASDSSQHDAEVKEIRAMHWSRGTEALPESHGHFNVPSSGRMIVGTEATRLEAINNGVSEGNAEGIVAFKHRLLYLKYKDSGYVTADDWKDVDTDKMLADMKDATEAGNEERRKNGVPTFHVVSWVAKPTFDAQNKAVRWVVGLDGSTGPFVNAIALKLGRHGYERFVLVSDGTDPQGDARLLTSMTNDYSFDPGSRFSDHLASDKLAGFGIAALVGTAAGATLAKTGLLAAAILIAKKFFILIIAALAGGFRWLRNRFKPQTTFGPPPAAS